MLQSPGTLGLQKYFVDFICANTVKVTIFFMRKIHGYKFSQVKAGGKNGENFLLVKISGYTVLKLI